MTSQAVRLVRLTPQLVVLLLAAAVAWVLVVALSQDMDAMSGTMGLDFPAFAVFWLLMMAAMMLPSVAPVASMYTRSISERRLPRLLLFASGYLVVWAIAAIPAFGAAWLVEQVTADREAVSRGLAFAVFAICGVYQLSPLKAACLRHCRSPLSLLLHYGGFRGPVRDFRAGAHHGLYCLGCCWSLMVLLIAIGVMNLPAMALLAVAIAAEKLWPRGPLFARLFGVAALVLAVVALWVPGVAPGLSAGNDESMPADMMSWVAPG